MESSEEEDRDAIDEEEEDEKARPRATSAATLLKTYFEEQQHKEAQEKKLRELQAAKEAKEAQPPATELPRSHSDNPSSTPSAQSSQHLTIPHSNSQNLDAHNNEPGLLGIQSALTPRTQEIHQKAEKGEKESMISLEGWLWKIGGKATGTKGKWQKRWFVLTREQLLYLKTPAGPKVLGTIPLASISGIPDNPTARAYSFGIVTPGRTYYVAPEREEDKKAWVTLLSRNVENVKKKGVVILT
eukprot:TRINITY_DN3101_c0_g2_i1.p1 TRINITY_DN3101_c0_g2~~TRINITY_DN3101_c0_g2_i1.p1  ORF type:complete len:243 (-),score=61.85 TRINITY_DN3101_c0_g2_i1:134-862(-)